MRNKELFRGRRKAGRIVGLVLTLALAVSLLSGCGQSKERHGGTLRRARLLRQSDRLRQKAGRLCQRLPRSRGIRRGKDFLRRVRRRLRMGKRQHIRGVSLCRLYRLPRRDGEPRPRGRVRRDRGRERKLCAGRSLRERDGQNLRRDKADGGYHGAEHYLY